MTRSYFDRVTEGRQTAHIPGVIREVWEHDSANGQEASRIVDPHAPETAWLEVDPDALVEVRAPDGSDHPAADAGGVDA